MESDVEKLAREIDILFASKHKNWKGSKDAALDLADFILSREAELVGEMKVIHARWDEEIDLNIKANKKIAALKAACAEKDKALEKHQCPDDGSIDTVCYAVPGNHNCTARKALSPEAGRGMVEALEWYADQKTWSDIVFKHNATWGDFSEKTRKALGRE